MILLCNFIDGEYSENSGVYCCFYNNNICKLLLKFAKQNDRMQIEIILNGTNLR